MAPKKALGLEMSWPSSTRWGLELIIVDGLGMHVPRSRVASAPASANAPAVPCCRALRRRCRALPQSRCRPSPAFPSGSLLLFIRVPYHIGDPKKDPNLENYPVAFTVSRCHSRFRGILCSTFRCLSVSPPLRHFLCSRDGAPSAVASGRVEVTRGRREPNTP